MMATRNKYRQKWLKWHSTYEKRATKELRKTFKTWIKAIKWNELQAGSYKGMINTAFNIELLNRSYIIIYSEIGKVHGKRVGKDINISLKSFQIGQFITFFERNIGRYLLRYGVRRIKTVRQTFFEFIIDLIANRLEKEQDMREVARQIQKEVNKPNFYRFQAERIARTESTAAANFAAIQAGKVSGFEMVKEWISAHDNRVRNKPEDEFDHMAKDGIQIGLDEKFSFNSGADLLDYPGDPTGEAENVINCRCTVAIVAKRDKDGNLTPTN